MSSWEGERKVVGSITKEHIASSQPGYRESSWNDSEGLKYRRRRRKKSPAYSTFYVGGRRWQYLDEVRVVVRQVAEESVAKKGAQRERVVGCGHLVEKRHNDVELGSVEKRTLRGNVGSAEIGLLFGAP